MGYVLDMQDQVSVGDDGLPRCLWPGMDEVYREYHDEEWGVPVVDDTGLFERVCLEGFQSGLSWITVLRKRNNFREAFTGFDIEKVAGYGQKDLQRLMDNSGIIRHRGKILATISNAQRAAEIIDEIGSLAKYFWSWEPEGPRSDSGSAPAFSAGSEALSRDLKSRGWSWVGPTTMYSFMQAVGMVNDHARNCHSWETIEHMRVNLDRP